MTPKALMVSIGILVSICFLGCSPVSSQVGGFPTPETYHDQSAQSRDLDTMDLPTFTEKDSTIQTSVGQEFIIKLESNPTTGYSWQISDDYDTDVIELVDSEYKGSGTKRIGAGGHDLWRFKAVGSGDTKLTLKYYRSWEKDVAPAKSQIYEIVIFPPVKKEIPVLAM